MFQLPNTPPPNFNSIPYMANPNGAQMQPQQGMQVPQQQPTQQMPIQQAMQQSPQMANGITNTNGIGAMSGPPPSFGAQPSYLSQTNTGGIRPGPTVNGLAGRVGNIALAGPSPQFSRFTGVR